MKTKTFALLFLSICLLLSACTSSYAIDWGYSLEEAIEKAKNLDKPIMVDFFGTWCGYCKKLDRETFANDKVDALSDKFICVKLDTDKHQELSQKHNVRGLPTVVFFDKEGKEIQRVIGFRNASDFLEAMNEVLAK